MNPFLPKPTYIPDPGDTIALCLIIGAFWLLALFWLARPVKK